MIKTKYLLAALLLAGLWTAEAAAQTVLRFNQWLPPKHFIVTQGLLVWAGDVARVTGGRVKVEMTTKSLGAPPRQFDLALKGIADVAWGVQGYTPGRFLSAEMAELPLSGTSAEALSVAYWRTYQKVFKSADEYKGVKLLVLHVHPPGQIGTHKKAITSMADLKGVKIRIVNPATSRILAFYGGVPVSAPAPKAYDLFSKGIIDGTFISLDGVASFHLDKFIKHAIEVPAGLYNTSFFIVMNQAKWDSLAGADQRAIEGISGEYYGRNIGRVWDGMARKGRALALEKGANITTLSGKALDGLRRELAFVEKDWITRATKKGLDAKAGLAMLRAEVAKYK